MTSCTKPEVHNIITTPPEEDQSATAIHNMRTNFGEDRTYGSVDLIVDRQTHTHIDTLIIILRSPIGEE